MPADVRFGSKAGISDAQPDVRQVSQADIYLVVRSLLRLGLIRREPAALRHAATHGLIRLAAVPALAHTDRAVRLELTVAPGAAVGAEPRRLLLCGHATRKQK
jgi:hypothetical protein